MGDSGEAWEATKRFMASSVAAAIAETCTLPTDVAKTRLQVDTTGRFNGMADCMRVTASEDGLSALWKGLAPALIRQVCYSSLAMVLFEPLRDMIVPMGQEPRHEPRCRCGVSLFGSHERHACTPGPSHVRHEESHGAQPRVVVT